MTTAATATESITDAQIRKAVKADITQHLTNCLTPQRAYPVSIDNVKALIVPLAARVSKLEAYIRAVYLLMHEGVGGSRVADSIIESIRDGETPPASAMLICHREVTERDIQIARELEARALLAKEGGGK